MHNLKQLVHAALAPLGLLLLPAKALGHEVYVLPPHQVEQAMETPRFDMVQVAVENSAEFIFWTVIACIAVFLIFSLSIVRPFERRFNPKFNKLKKYAAPIVRITLGLGLLAGAYFGASFGPELPAVETFGGGSALAALLAGLVGIMLVCNVYPRIAALIALALFLVNVLDHGVYMLTYTNYVGAILFSFIAFRGGKQKLLPSLQKISAWMAPYQWLLLRVTFGVSLIFSSFFAKILHNNLALMVANQQLAGHPLSIAQYLGFDPHFLVLGAAIIEIMIGIFFIVGIEIRFTALFVEFWLFLSLLYFGESVWPHLILIGIPIALFIHGYDKYSLEGLYFKRGKREPVF